MKNVLEILKDLEIEVPEDKTSALSKAISENYKTVAEIEKKNSKYELQLEQMTERATNAEEALKAFDGVDVEGFKKKIADLEELNKQKDAEYAQKEQQRLYSEAVKNAVEGIEFTSNGAKKAFISDLEAENLTLKDGNLLGLNDFIDSYKKNDASAFVDDSDKNKAKFTDPLNPQAPKTETHEAEMRKAMGLD